MPSWYGAEDREGKWLRYVTYDVYLNDLHVALNVVIAFKLMLLILFLLPLQCVFKNRKDVQKQYFP